MIIAEWIFSAKCTGDNLENIDVMRIVNHLGVETAVAVEGRKRKTTVLGFHSLRHSFASFCAEAGIPKSSMSFIPILGKTPSEQQSKLSPVQPTGINALSECHGCGDYFFFRKRERFWAVVTQPYFCNSAAISLKVIPLTCHALICSA